MADTVEQAPEKAGGIECRPAGPSDVLCAPDEPLTAQSGAQLPQRPIVLVHLPYCHIMAIMCCRNWWMHGRDNLM